MADEKIYELPVLEAFVPPLPLESVRDPKEFEAAVQRWILWEDKTITDMGGPWRDAWNNSVSGMNAVLAELPHITNAKANADRAEQKAAEAAASATVAAGEVAKAMQEAVKASSSAKEAEYWRDQAEEIATGNIPPATDTKLGLVTLSDIKQRAFYMGNAY